jgi:hypothetical protein
VAVADSLLHAGGPVVALAAFALVALFTRWAFGSDRARDRGHRGPGDDGLLTHVATLSRRESALALRALLSDAGIRSTVRFPEAYRAEVLVFPEDADRARQLATSFGGGS